MVYKTSLQRSPAALADLFIKNSIGFDPIFSTLKKMDVNYPPYNIIDSDDGTCIEVALAGYSKDDINVFIEDNILHVSYEKTETNEENMRYKGIAKRSFKRTFALSDAIEVKSATMIDGLLRIELKEITPETKRISVTIN